MGNAKKPARCFGQDIMRGEWASRERESLSRPKHQVSNDRAWVKSPNSLGDFTERQAMGLTVSESGAKIAEAGTGTSIFDPVLCEIAYRWFSPKGGTVIDPFAGGSVRGVVASKLGRQYVGIELREEQVAANRVQGTQLCQDPVPVWKCGDSADIDAHCQGVQADLLFSCPPYADLEVYSEDSRDISNMPYDKFLEAYRTIIAKSCSLLRDHRFACFVVGEVRDKKGIYRNFVGDTVRAFLDAGMAYYNEAILVTAIGSLPIRTGRMFEAGRKMGKTHQNVLIFVKGNPKTATEACGPVDMSFMEQQDGEDAGL